MDGLAILDAPRHYLRVNVDIAQFVERAHPQWQRDDAVETGTVLRDLEALAQTYEVTNCPDEIRDLIEHHRYPDEVQALGRFIANDPRQGTAPSDLGNVARLGHSSQLNIQTTPGLARGKAQDVLRANGVTTTVRPDSVVFNTSEYGDGAWVSIEGRPSFDDSMAIRLSIMPEGQRPKRVDVMLMGEDGASRDTAVGLLKSIRNSSGITNDEHRGHPLRQMWRALEKMAGGVPNDLKETSIWGEGDRRPVDVLPKGYDRGLGWVDRGEDGSLSLRQHSTYGGTPEPIPLTPAAALQLACDIVAAGDSEEFDPLTHKEGERELWNDLVALAGQKDGASQEPVPKEVLNYLKEPVKTSGPAQVGWNELPAGVSEILNSPQITLDMGDFKASANDDWWNRFTVGVTDNDGATEPRAEVGFPPDPENNPNVLTRHQLTPAGAAELVNRLEQLPNANRLGKLLEKLKQTV